MLIADDRPIFRDGLSSLLEPLPGIEVVGRAKDGADAVVPFPQLTEREREVLDLIAAGRSNAQIAATLYLSPKTVRNNVSTILTKLQATDRPTMIIQARDAGLGQS